MIVNAYQDEILDLHAALLSPVGSCVAELRPDQVLTGVKRNFAMERTQIYATTPHAGGRCQSGTPQAQQLLAGCLIGSAWSNLEGTKVLSGSPVSSFPARAA